MIITCPKCDTNFKINISQIGKEGKKVKCSKCSYIWTQMPAAKKHKEKIEPMVEKPKQIEEFKERANLPMVVQQKEASSPNGIMLLMLVFIVFLLLNLFPQSIKNINLFGANHLSVKEVNISHGDNDNHLTVSYKIFNSSQKNHNMPMVRIKLFGEGKKLLKTVTEDRRNLKIMPGRFIEVQTQFKQAIKGAEEAEVMIGNKLDFMLY